jgi:predicted lipoprotein with Yx(FWY)xxD motif
MIGTARISSLGVTAAIPLVAASFAACGSSGASPTPAPTAPKTVRGQAATVGLENDGSLGKVLVDSGGRTLYLFEKDSGGRSACSAACAVAWPPLRADGKPVAASGLTPSKLGITTRPDGKPQVTYNGHPLYRYAGDNRPGDTKGQGLAAFGAAWFAVSGAGMVVTRPGSNPNSGVGY